MKVLSEAGQHERPLKFILAENGAKVRSNLIDQFKKSLSKSVTVVENLGEAEDLKANLEPRRSLLQLPQDNANEETSRVFEIDQNNDLAIVQNSYSQPEKFVKSLTRVPSVGESWTLSYQNYLRNRRQWWKRLAFNPSVIQATEENARSEDVSAMIEARFGNGNSNGDNMENLGPATNLGLESIRMVADGQVRYNSKTRLFESTLDIQIGTLVMLIDSVRSRVFDDSSYRIALRDKLCPIQVGIFVDNDSNNVDLTDLGRYIQLLLEKEDVIVSSECQDLAEADLLGIPYVIHIKESSLDNGVVRIRDRETTWFEEIHVAHLAPRFATTFHDKIIPDTWTALQSSETTG